MVLYKLTLFVFQKFFNHQSIQAHVSAWLPMTFKSKQAPIQIKEEIYKILIVDCTSYTPTFHETVFAFWKILKKHSSNQIIQILCNCTVHTFYSSKLHVQYNKHLYANCTSIIHVCCGLYFFYFEVLQATLIFLPNTFNN